MQTVSTTRRGFTLIELLIVVAIIAILAAIAVPNFLEAQTRSKISRGKADMRTFALALEAYKLDTNSFPYYPYASWGEEQLWTEYLYPLTTPISYLTSVKIADPFVPTDMTAEQKAWAWMPDKALGSYTYRYYGEKNLMYGWAYMMNKNGAGIPYKETVMVASYGPDRSYSYSEYQFLASGSGGYRWAARGWAEQAWYDPTNGTISKGDIFRFCGEIQGMN